MAGPAGGGARDGLRGFLLFGAPRRSRLQRSYVVRCRFLMCFRVSLVLEQLVFSLVVPSALSLSATPSAGQLQCRLMWTSRQRRQVQRDRVAGMTTSDWAHAGSLGLSSRPGPHPAHCHPTLWWRAKTGRHRTGWAGQKVLGNRRCCDCRESRGLLGPIVSASVVPAVRTTSVRREARKMQ